MRVIAVTGVHNEEQTIANTLRQLNRAGVDGIVVVENGCTDNSHNEVLSTATQIRCPLCVEHFTEPLGHDVPRAIGTYKALRTFGRNGLVVYVDADWGGSFGPNLRKFIRSAQATRSDVYSISWHATSKEWRQTRAATSWCHAIRQQRAVPSLAAPFLMPMAARLALFSALSPSLLAHPGLWFAAISQAGYTWHADEGWMMQMVGHQTPSRRHSNAILQLLEQDAEEARMFLQHNTTPTSILAAESTMIDRVKQNRPMLPNRDIASLLAYAAEGIYER